MVIAAFALIGIGLGLRNAARRGGSGLDRLQFAAVGAILGAILGTFATIGLERML